MDSNSPPAFEYRFSKPDRSSNTWEWDYEHTGMWQGHYYGNNYAGAKQDFAVRSGLIPRSLLFEQSELDELYRCCQRTRELDETLSYFDEQKLINLQEHMEVLSPGIGERYAVLESPVGPEAQFEQTMLRPESSVIPD